MSRTHQWVVPPDFLIISGTYEARYAHATPTELGGRLLRVIVRYLS